MPEIAIVIPAHITNAEQAGWLQEALESVYLQSFQAWELVVVDDGSPFAVQWPDQERVIHHPEPRGPGAARNSGVTATTAPWLLALDADDRLPPDALTDLYGMRCEQGVTYGDLEWIGGRTGYQRLFDWNLTELRRLTGPIGVTALFHRTAWAMLGGWREDLPGLEDIEFWIRLTEQGICGVHLDVSTLQYRQHADSRTQRLKPYFQAVASRIRDMHRPFMNGGGRMPCNSCPGGRLQQQLVQEQRMPIPDGAIELRYVGPALGSFTTPQSPTTGNRYRVDGRGAYIMADPRDVEHLTNWRQGGYPAFEQVFREPPAPVSAAPVTVATPMVAPMVVSEPVVLSTHVPDITAHNVKQALGIIADTQDLLDLRVMLAQENVSATKRGTVVRALEKRMEELSGQDN